MVPQRFRSHIAWLVAGALLVSLSSGCAMQRNRINVENPFSRLEKIKPRQTRSSELLGIMGTAPSNVIPIAPDKQGWVYSYGDSKSWMVGLIIFNVQKINTGVDTAVIVVDPSGYVSQVIAGSNSKNLRWQFWPFGGE